MCNYKLLCHGMVWYGTSQIKEAAGTGKHYGIAPLDLPINVKLFQASKARETSTTIHQ